MMRKGVVTVVLPVYGVEKYLNRCIESVVNQTYKHLEIILVDDCSQDRSPQICDEWAEKDERIKVIHKPKNEGLGFARNTGIENATGEYICFLDSDDYVALDLIEKSYQCASKNQADLVLYGFYNVDVEGKIQRKTIPHVPKPLFTDQEILKDVLPNLVAPRTDDIEWSGLWMSACGCLFSLELIERAKWRFVSERQIISEDVYSLLRLYKDVKRVAVLPEAFYFYCQNQLSLTHVYRPDRYEKIKAFYDGCIRVCDEYVYPAEIKKRLAGPYLSFTIATLKMIVRANSTATKKKQLFRDIIQDPHLQQVAYISAGVYGSKARKALLWGIKAKWWRLCWILVNVKA